MARDLYDKTKIITSVICSKVLTTGECVQTKTKTKIHILEPTENEFNVTKSNSLHITNKYSLGPINFVLKPISASKSRQNQDTFLVTNRE